MFYFNSIDKNLWMNRQRAVYVRWPLYTSTFAVRWWVYLHWVTIRWNWVQFSGSFRALDLYYPHASNVIYIVFHNKKKPIDVIRFSRIKKIYSLYQIFFLWEKNQTTCAFKITSIVSLCMRGCALEMSKSVK